MDIVESIIFVIPTICLTVVLIFVLKKQKEKTSDRLQQDQQIKSGLELKSPNENQKFFLPHRVEAYQRIILFLERISPNSLVMRHFDANQSYKDLQKELLTSIRNEFEHNIAQQVFLSPKEWKMVKESKEEIIKIINLASSQIEDKGTSFELSSKIFEISAQLEKLPTEITNEYLIKELQKLF
jgi:hypothetical protein